MQAIREPQPGRNTFRDLYTYHIGQAWKQEQLANALMDRERQRLGHVNPAAGKESIDTMVAENHYVKAAISKQQFHVRQASMYGSGMIVEALGAPFSTRSKLQEFLDGK